MNNNKNNYFNLNPHESGLYRVNEQNVRLYDSDFVQQVDNTGGRVDQSVYLADSSDLYGNEYKTNTINPINRSGYITDIDPRATIIDGRGQVQKRFFRASDLYIVPTGSNGTGDRSFYSSIQNTSLTSYVRNSLKSGGPIRLPNLPRSAGIARSFGTDAPAGYIQCMTSGNKIANGGLVPLASSPQNIQDNTSVEIASDTAIGSSQGFDIYSSTSTRTVNFSFDVYADYLPSPFNNVKEYCLALKQMNYPTYSSLRVNSPDAIFVYGGIRIRGIPQISCTYETTTKNGIVDKANVSVQITETEAIVDGVAKI